MLAQHRLIELPERADSRGTLMFGQMGDHIPFLVKRFFAIYDVTEGAGRGSHAHREQHQFLVMLKGSADITVRNGTTDTRITLNKPNLALYAPPMLWLELDNFSADSCCMVLVSDVYQESDYIRDWDSFMKLVRREKEDQ